MGVSIRNKQSSKHLLTKISFDIQDRVSYNSSMNKQGLKLRVKNGHSEKKEE